MRISETRLKLEEADYFFNQMRASQDQDNVFAFNLSAFISAARSITWIMQKEFTHLHGFENWYSQKQSEMNADEDFKFFNNLRVISVHRQSIPLNRLVKVGALKAELSLEPVEVVIEDADGKLISRSKSVPQDKSSEKAKGITVESYWFFTGKQKNVVGHCKDYLDKLDKIVQDCEIGFLK